MKGEVIPYYIHYGFSILFCYSLGLLVLHLTPHTNIWDLAAAQAQSIASGFVLFNGASTFLHYWFYYSQKGKEDVWKIQAKSFLTPEDFWHAVWLGNWNIVVTSFMSGCLQHYVAAGAPSKFYFDPLERGIIHLPLNLMLVWLYIDVSAYTIHYFLHTPIIYKSIHKWHHRYKHPVPWTIVAMSPIEIICLSTPIFLTPFIFPVWAPGFVFLIVYNYYYGLLDHSGIKMEAAFPWQVNTTWHDDHHQFFHCNFGQNLDIWDKWMGTNRDYNRHYDETTFGQKCQKVASQTQEKAHKGA